MQQDDSYPDPAQLRAYAEEPIPFHPLKAQNLELLEDDERVADGTLRASIDPVEYRFGPSYIRLQPEEGDHYYAKEYPDWSFGHADSWDGAGDIEAQEDYICATGFVPGVEGGETMYEAFWVLSEVTIRADE